MISRDIEQYARKVAQNFRAMAIVGPRQSGKSTLAKKLFPEKEYVSLENPDNFEMAVNDPRLFLSRFISGAIIDEAQGAPKLFNYLQEILDETRENSLFVLTGSNNFLLQESITQSLAGRIGYLDLYPLSFQEIKKFKVSFSNPEEWIFNGSYPEIYDKQRRADIWYESYIRSYVERDVKQLRNIESTTNFITFLRVCAGHIGKQINMNSISSDTGIDVRTLNSWMSILESSYIIFRLPPHHVNFNRRLVKSPKLYFYDTGLASALLGIKKPDDVFASSHRGALFENLVIADIKKQQVNFHTGNELFFWRDQKGLEIDLLIDTSKNLIPIEIKAAKTIKTDFFKNLLSWNKLSQQKFAYLIHAGESNYARNDGIEIVSWKKFSTQKWLN